ncbi:MAG: NAD(P)-dependent glycerol-3-phosphate dehydrogenase [Proteobacteria bacterium]|nr:NAD(P)-dependent glycerol-3-phosphate dehydrogenase [Pseudomonadota bacterium]
MRVAVIGAGAWGTTLANLFAANGRDTLLWVREPELALEMQTTRTNSVFLPDHPIHPDLAIESDPAKALSGRDVFIMVVPSQFTRSTLASFAPLLPQSPIIVCASKGIELDTMAPMSLVVAEALEGKNPRYASLSGPSFADEVSRGVPTTVSLGCEDPDLGAAIQALLSTPLFRVYTTTDFRGVELGGAVKNIIAIAAGIADGLNYGHNTRAALITRGLAEISRLGAAMGANERTFMGLSGMGDLVLTCTGDLSRNRQVGLKLGRGMKLDQIVGEMKAVAEGVKTTKSVHTLATSIGVEMPITAEIFAILYEGKDPSKAVRDLMSRDLKQE